MPYKCEHIKLSESQDRRRKLTEAQKAEIRQLYSEGFGSWQSLADKYGVSKKTVGLIVNDDMAAKSKQYTKEHWKDYVDREKLTEATRNLRHYKHELYKAGKLK